MAFGNTNGFEEFIRQQMMGVRYGDPTPTPTAAPTPSASPTGTPTATQFEDGSTLPPGQEGQYYAPPQSPATPTGRGAGTAEGYNPYIKNVLFALLMSAIQSGRFGAPPPVNGIPSGLFGGGEFTPR